MSSYSQVKESNENIVLSFIKGLIVSMLISFALVILFAFLLKWFSLGDSLIFGGTMIIKALSAGVGAIFAVKGKSRGLFKGILFGLVYIIIAFLVFSFLAGSFAFDGQTVLDFVSCAIVGGIVGVIKVNK